MKHCKFCDRTLTSANFCYHPAGKDNLNNKCRECQSEYRRKRYRLTRERELSQMQDWRNSGKKAESNARRRTAERRVYGDKDAVDFVYFCAATLKKVYGNPGPQVDHIVPLINTQVCGLHTASNLQLLSGTDNRIKSNRWRID